jgi:hypothetical protein
MARHIRRDEVDATLQPTRRRPFVLAAGLTGLVVGAAIAGGGIAAADHASQPVSNAPFVDGGQPPPGPPGPDDQQGPPGQPAPGAPGGGQPGAPGAPPPPPPGAPGQ